MCPDSNECRLFWGGYTKGCRVHAVTGAIAPGVPNCPLISLSEITVSLAAPEPDQILEGDSGTTAVTFTVSLSGAVSSDTTVRVVWEDVSAAQPQDYTANDTTLVFEPGEPTSQTITAQIVGDDAAESDESFRAIISDARSTSHTMLGVGAEDQAFIVDDDPTISVLNTSVTEGNDGDVVTANFAVVLSHGNSPNPVSVSAETVDGFGPTGATVSNDDYQQAAESVVFPPGETNRTFSVDVLGDTDGELDEYFVARLFAPVDATIADDIASGTILNDDATSSPPP
jgi:hypothetical protein